MLHGRALRPAAVGARPLEVDEKSIAHLKGARVVRLHDYIAVVAEDEWTAVRAARELKLKWSQGAGLVGSEGVRDSMRRGPFVRDDTLKSVGDTAPLAATAGALRATYFWPVQSHASMGPSCAVADVHADGATVWTASQATHRYQGAYARMLGLPKDKVRLIYVDGAGCYGMNGHDDAAADAVLLSKADRPAGARAVVARRRARLGPEGPAATARAARRARRQRAASHTGKPRCGCRWRPRTSHTCRCSHRAKPHAAARRAGGRPHLAERRPAVPRRQRQGGRALDQGRAAAPVEHPRAGQGGQLVRRREFRRRARGAGEGRSAGVSLARALRCARARGAAALRRADGLAPARRRAAPGDDLQRGVGLSYVHYKHNETYVAIAMEVEARRSTGEVRVKRIACAHDCGLMINPDAVRNQVEGNILQTLSRTLYEETLFDTQRVTSVQWSSYRLLRFPEVPELMIDLVSRPELPRSVPARPRAPRCPPHWRTRSPMRAACACAKCRSARRGSRRRGRRPGEIGAGRPLAR